MIKVKNLNFSYESSEYVIKNLNFEIKRGEIFGFLGPSGAGKSTTQKIIMSNLKAYEGSRNAKINMYNFSNITLYKS